MISKNGVTDIFISVPPSKIFGVRVPLPPWCIRLRAIKCFYGNQQWSSWLTGITAANHIGAYQWGHGFCTVLYWKQIVQCGLSKNIKVHVRETNKQSMSRERQTKKEMFQFSTKNIESLTLSDITRQTVPQPRSSSAEGSVTDNNQPSSGFLKLERACWS